MYVIILLKLPFVTLYVIIMIAEIMATPIKNWFLRHSQWICSGRCPGPICGCSVLTMDSFMIIYKPFIIDAASFLFFLVLGPKQVIWLSHSRQAKSRALVRLRMRVQRHNYYYVILSTVVNLLLYAKIKLPASFQCPY